MSDIKESEFGDLKVRMCAGLEATIRVELPILKILVEKAILEIQEEEDKRILELWYNQEHTVCG
jgi:hypothetical protein